MPKATVHQDHFLTRDKYQVRRSRQISAMQSKSESEPVRNLPHDQLRLGILLPYLAHLRADLIFATVLHHNKPYDASDQTAADIEAFIEAGITKLANDVTVSEVDRDEAAVAAPFSVSLNQRRCARLGVLVGYDRKSLTGNGPRRASKVQAFGVTACIPEFQDVDCAGVLVDGVNDPILGSPANAKEVSAIGCTGERKIAPGQRSFAEV